MDRARRILIVVVILAFALSLTVCTSNTARPRPNSTSAKPAEKATKNRIPVIHVFVALADNVNQGIVPVSAALGNGDSTKTNLYWGAAFGVRTFFSRSKDWELVSATSNPRNGVLERCIFKHRKRDLILVADAYQGQQIALATADFLDAASGKAGEKLTTNNLEFYSHGSAELVAYVGHNGLMDFKLNSSPRQLDEQKRQAIILACASKQYFTQPLQATGAAPLLWTTNLMAPEAYVLSAAIDGWMNKESGEQVRLRAATAYNKYQHCGLKSAMGLFATGW
jgi:hypothetical protein